MEPLSTTQRRVLDHLDTKQTVDLLQALVQIPSETGNEGAASRFLIDYLRDHGIEAKGYEGAPDRPNVVGTWAGAGEGPTVMLSTHLDTLPPGDLSRWTTDPYGGESIDGRIFGRGSMDSKGGIAAAVAAVQAVRRAGIALQGDVQIVATVDDEVAGPAGMRHVVEHNIIDPDISVYCAHSDLTIKACFKGLLWTTLTFRGQVAHGSMPHRGVNAVAHASRFMTALNRRSIPYPRHPILGDFTFNVGWIHAGPDRKYNLVPDLCELGIDMRLVPGQTPDGVLAEIERLLAELGEADSQFDASIDVLLAEAPVEVGEDDPAVQAIRRAAHLVLGREPAMGGSISTGNFGPLFREGKTGVAFGPGDLDRCNGHKPDEFLEVDQLIAAAQIYALMLLDVPGAAP